MQRLVLDVHLDQREMRRSMASDVLAGLTAKPKYILPKYFYDAQGSILFDQITDQPEYYVTRTELSLLERIAPELIRLTMPREILEIGSGSSRKFQMLLNALPSEVKIQRYLPFDVSKGALMSAADSLLSRYNLLEIHGIIGDFERHLDMVPPSIDSRLILFLGSTLGNLEASQRLEVLTNIAALLKPGDYFLLGVDLVKNKSTLEAAYDDAKGVTAQFNQNILSVMNSQLGANFIPAAFKHHAFYNSFKARIEMHLLANARQTVRVRSLDLDVQFSEGESIWTESSYKFTEASTASMLSSSGLTLNQWYTDDRGYFGLALATVR